VLRVDWEASKLAQQAWRKTQQILLVFRCKKPGSAKVEMELTFHILEQTRTVNLAFRKMCGEVSSLASSEPTFLGNLFYYLVCFLGILFGFYVIKWFKHLMEKEQQQSDTSIDTSYKRKYDKLSEIPRTDIVTQN
jgi:hypothetical protein